MQKNLELQGRKCCMAKGTRGSIQRLAFVRGRTSVEHLWESSCATAENFYLLEFSVNFLLLRRLV